MQTDGAKVVVGSNVFVNLPMTNPSGKVRVKRRSFFAEYGEPIATRQVPISQSCYVEWQIGYDLLATPENKNKTTLQSFSFRNYKGKNKYCYELGEIVYYALELGLINEGEVRTTYEAIKAVSEKGTFEETASIARTNPKMDVINGLEFYAMQVSYPLFVHRFGEYEILAEIMIREQQRAVGTQAMLYVCIPIASLKFRRQPIGRPLDAKECAEWHIGRNEALLALELFRVFGMLSPKHRHDVMAIFECLFEGL